LPLDSMVRRFSVVGQFPARALSGPVAPRGAESGKISSERAVARPELLMQWVALGAGARAAEGVRDEQRKFMIAHLIFPLTA